MTVVDRLGPEHRDRVWRGRDGWIFRWLPTGQWRCDRTEGGGCPGYLIFREGADIVGDRGPFTEVTPALSPDAVSAVADDMEMLRQQIDRMQNVAINLKVDQLEDRTDAWHRLPATDPCAAWSLARYLDQDETAHSQWLTDPHGYVRQALFGTPPPTRPRLVDADNLIHRLTTELDRVTVEVDYFTLRHPGGPTVAYWNGKRDGILAALHYLGEAAGA